MKRLYYLDNLKLSLTLLVILHHIAIVFGGNGAFAITSHTTGTPFFNTLMTLFLSINQSYFMGLFFALSAYFSYHSLKTKTTQAFIIAKSKRLLIPALFYYVIISPLISTLVHFYDTKQLRFIYSFDIGALWFVLALFLFDVIYAFIKRPVCHPKQILLWLPLGVLLTFLIRIIYPVGSFIPIIAFQPAHFVSYIIAYNVGLSAAAGHGYESYFKIKWLLTVPVILILLGMISYQIIQSGHDLSYAFGGFNVYALLYSLYDMLMLVVMSCGLIGLFKKYFNHSSPSFIRYTFGAYVMHALAIVVAVMLATHLTQNHYLALMITLIIALPLSFILGKITRL